AQASLDAALPAIQAQYAGLRDEFRDIEQDSARQIGQRQTDAQRAQVQNLAMLRANALNDIAAVEADGGLPESLRAELESQAREVQTRSGMDALADDQLSRRLAQVQQESFDDREAGAVQAQ